MDDDAHRVLTAIAAIITIAGFIFGAISIPSCVERCSHSSDTEDSDITSLDDLSSMRQRSGGMKIEISKPGLWGTRSKVYLILASGRKILVDEGTWHEAVLSPEQKRIALLSRAQLKVLFIDGSSPRAFELRSGSFTVQRDMKNLHFLDESTLRFTCLDDNSRLRLDQFPMPSMGTYQATLDEHNVLISLRKHVN